MNFKENEMRKEESPFEESRVKGIKTNNERKLLKKVFFPDPDEGENKIGKILFRVSNIKKTFSDYKPMKNSVEQPKITSFYKNNLQNIFYLHK